MTDSIHQQEPESADPRPLVGAPFINMAFWHTDLDDSELLRVLTEATCPIVCVGYVNETGWHTECERRAVEAFRVLRGWIGA